MATTPRPPRRAVEYPTSDGKPMAETETHGRDMIDLLQTLRDRFAAEPDVYVWGNMLMFYEEGNPRKHVSPDVFVVRGVARRTPRDHYLVWEEGKGPDLVIELTSKTTRAEDQKKLALYRDVLKVHEYFLFDPKADYLKPPMQGYRLREGRYDPIAFVQERLPSAVLGLHLERDGTELRLFDPVAGRRLLTPAEQRAEALDALRREEEARRQAEAENERLRRELEELRRRLPGAG